MSADKKTNRVSVFFGDSEFGCLALDADAADREPADFLRFLWREFRREQAERHAQKVREWALQCEEQRQQRDAQQRQSVASVAAMRDAVAHNRTRPVWEGREDQGFPRTVSTGDGA